MGVCNCSMFCCTLLYVHFSIATILMGKRELVALLNSSSWCLVMVERLFLAVPRGCLQFVIVVFPDHTHLLFFSKAFDKVAHEKLLLKLHHYGIRGDTLKWIKDFLDNRKQAVVINGINSEKSQSPLAPHRALFSAQFSSLHT